VSPDADHARRLMMAALDGEISPAEREELTRLLSADGGLREEWARLSRVKEVTTAMRLNEPPAEMWDRYWLSVYNRAERGVGWILVSVGATVLLGYGAWSAIEALIGDTDMPLYLRLAILAVALGGIVLVVSVIREKLFTYRHDPYKEVER
jgi:hypothetical protein